MNKQFTFRHMEHSPVLEEYANKQLQKIEEFLKHEREPIYIIMVFEPGRPHAHHQIELRVKTAEYELISEFEGPEFYDVLDHVIDVMYKQLHEKKRELLDERRSADYWKGV